MTNKKDREIIISYYDNDKIEYKSSYNNNKLDGPTYYYSKSGNLISYTEYKEGFFHGLSRLYYANGQLRVESTYLYGHIDGQENHYYLNGKLKLRNIYDYGIKTKTIRWKENGDLI